MTTPQQQPAGDGGQQQPPPQQQQQPAGDGGQQPPNTPEGDDAHVLDVFRGVVREELANYFDPIVNAPGAGDGGTQQQPPVGDGGQQQPARARGVLRRALGI